MKTKTMAEKMIDLRGTKRRKEVADAVGISVSAVAMYERGKRVPKDSIKKRIAKYYGVSVETLFYQQ